jgi:HK97 family phage major capsid protein
MTSVTHKIPEGLARHLDGGNVLKRSLQLDRSGIDLEARTVTLAFASEAPYERYWGVEILEVSSRAMRQNRLSAGAALLSDHDTNKQIGVVEQVEVGTDRVARAVVRFGKSARAEEEFQDVQDGIRRHVSFGYLIHEAALVGTKDGVETYRVSDYEPYEISLVSVPADIQVGVGRALELSAETALTPLLKTSQGKNMTIQDTTAAAAAAAPAAASPAVITTERNHAVEIGKLATAFGASPDLALRSIQAGHTVEQFQEALIAQRANQPLKTADIGLSQKEVKQYSVLRALNALANPQDARAQAAAAFERECSVAVEQRSGKQSQGLFMPYEVQKRDLTAGTSNAGGTTVATDVLGGSFIDMLRHQLALESLGVTVLGGLVGNVSIPKQTGSGTAYWVAENNPATESQLATGQVGLSPKTLAGFQDISRRLMLQSSVDVESLVSRDLAAVLALELQRAVFHGSGASNQPSGLSTLITPLSNGANGGALTWNNAIDLETAIAAANADVSKMAYVTNAKVRGLAKRTQRFASSNGNALWDAGTLPLNGYGCAVTNTIQSNITKGTGTNLSTIMFGNWADLMIGMWGTVDMLYDPYTGGASGTARIRVMTDVDVAVRNTESFAMFTDIVTA